MVNQFHEIFGGKFKKRALPVAVTGRLWYTLTGIALQKGGNAVPTIIPFSAVSACALARLSAAGSAFLHSAYRNTVNLMTPQGLVALQRSGSPLSPLSLITPFDTDGMEALAAFARQEIRFLPDGALQLGREEAGGGCILACATTTSVFDPRVPVSGRSGAQALAETTRPLLEAAEGRGLAAVYSGLSSADPATAAAAARLQGARDLLVQKKPREAVETLLKLVGLGSGLTPSGDDFLCGAAAALYAAGLSETVFGEALLSGIRASLTATNDISAAFLAAAADGLASEAVCALFSHTKKTGLPELISMFLAIGHSSGVDSLCGIDTVLHYIKDGLL